MKPSLESNLLFYAAQSFCSGGYTRINDESGKMDYQKAYCAKTKETFVIRPTIVLDAIRNLLIQNNVFSSDVTQQLKQNNSDTLEFILFYSPVLQRLLLKINMTGMNTPKKS